MRKQYIYIFAFFIIWTSVSLYTMDSSSIDSYTKEIFDTVMHISNQPCTQFPGYWPYCQDVYNDLGVETQNKILDYLYEQKYGKSPLWNKVRDANSKRTKHYDSFLYDEDHDAIVKERVNEWEKQDPAAQLYKQLVQLTNTDTEHQGIISSGWIRGYTNATNPNIKTLQGKTEIPLLIALNKLYVKRAIFLNEITSINDVDVEALKTCPRSRILYFPKISQDAQISPKIFDLRLRLIFEELPDAFRHLPSYDPYQSSYFEFEVIRNTTGRVRKNEKMVEEIQPTLVKTDSHNRQYSLYYQIDPYWKLKTVGKALLFIASFYAITKYMWLPLSHDLDFFNSHYNTLKNQHITATLDAVIKPHVTPELADALNIQLQLWQEPPEDSIAGVLYKSSNREATNYLEKLAGSASATVVANAPALGKASLLINRTRTITAQNYNLDTSNIQTPLGIVNKMGYTTANTGFWSLPCYIVYSCYSSFQRLCNGQPIKKIKSGILAPFWNFLSLPIRLLNEVTDIPCSYFYLGWIPKHAKSKLMVVAPQLEPSSTSS